MKSFFILALFLSTALLPSFGQTSRDFAVMANFELGFSPPTINLSWAPNNFIKFYEVYRRNYPVQAFERIATNITETSYTDANIVPDMTYEYLILARCSTRVVLNQVENNFVWAATGYLMAGHKKEPLRYGTALILVDETQAEAIKEELDGYIDGLVVSGWNVVARNVPRAETFDGAKVKQVKSAILAEKAKNPDISTVVLIGHVPVPYSGNFIAQPGQTYPPDGHEEHGGAWPSDLYYGVLEEDLWTDMTANNTLPGRPENDNIPGDGKFDQSTIPGRVELQIGRIDFYNLKMSSQSETELLKRYFGKVHKFKNGISLFNKKTLIDDNFPAVNFGFLENFSSGGWRNGAALTGKDNVAEADWFSDLGKDSYLFAYGTGPGYYNSCGGVTQSDQMATNPHSAAFTLLFGSYFGDWDSESNLMRTAIASEPSILTCSWSARPHWYMHSMAFGYPIGHTAMTAQNNSNDYFNMLVYEYDGDIYDGESVQVATRRIHPALMGDPTLTALDPERNATDLLPPAGLTIVKKGSKDISITWEIPLVEKIHHYDIFRSEGSKLGPWAKLNDEPLTHGEYIDNSTFEGEVWYMVRKREPYATVNGTQELYGYGRHGMITNGGTSVETGTEREMRVWPNPATDALSLAVNTEEMNGRLNIDISNGMGARVRHMDYGMVTSAGHTLSIVLEDNEGNPLPSGVYFLEVNKDNLIRTIKFTINK